MSSVINQCADFSHQSSLFSPPRLSSGGRAHLHLKCRLIDSIFWGPDKVAAFCEEVLLINS